MKLSQFEKDLGDKIFGAFFSNNKILEIPIIKNQKAIQNECVNNVKEHIKIFGGSIILGWRFLFDGQKQPFYELEAHAIWLDSNVDKKCVSRFPEAKKNYFLFIEDKNLQADDFPISNKFFNNTHNNNYLKIHGLKIFIEIKKIKILKKYNITSKEDFVGHQENYLYTKNQKITLEPDEIIYFKMGQVISNLSNIFPILSKDDFRMTLNHILEQIISNNNTQYCSSEQLVDILCLNFGYNFNNIK